MAGIWDEIRFPSAQDGKYIYKMLINGEWVESASRETFDVKNPANGEVFARAQLATKEDVDKALDGVYSVKKAINGMEAYKRAKILEKVCDLILQYKDEITNTIVKEAGKPVSAAEGEVSAAAQRFEYAAAETVNIFGEELDGHASPHKIGKIGLVFRQPVGVVLAISPFNYPFHITACKLAPAIAAGNAIIIKPASDDPISVIMLTRLIELAGMPKGTISVVTGSGSIVGDALVKSEKVDMISFTGSSAVGKHIASIAGMKRLHLELGGKTPAIVLNDADMDVAVKECVAGALKFSGQRCDAVSRILVEEGIADEFVNRVLEEVKKWKMGDPANKETNVGPLINEKALEKVKRLVGDAIDKGAKLLIGGKHNGLYFEPTVLDNVTEDMDIAKEETFGPVVCIMRVKNYEEAIRIANNTRYGLDACIFTSNINKAIDAGLRLEVGTVSINASPSHALGYFPFGGDKDSGIGREGIRYSIMEMTKPHTVIIKYK
ncbi:MAG TPA: aldehyde dehydrogenase family protein [Candidatus Aenigmarchaeota archaeon]|nr:aldehyde dehydrogenase family protein [Candidatus Aenigmarchaeota archaeon]